MLIQKKKEKKVVQTLRTEYVETPLGKIRFDENGDVTGIGFSV